VKKISNNYLIIIPIISLIGGIWQGQYTDDGYHWGFIFSNALDLIDGKVPYKEIFLEYGILTTIINSVILLIFNKNILSLMLITCIAYSLTIFLIALITQNFTEGKYYGFLSTIIIFMIYPWPVSPWPNFTSFFFTTLFCYLYLSEKKKYSLLAGTSLALAYLTFTTVYNIIIILFLLIILIFILIYRKKLMLDFIKKNILVSFGFLIIFLPFILYLFYNDLFTVWASYQKIPFILADKHNLPIYGKILDYIYFLFIYSFKNFIYEPQISVFLFFFLSNIALTIKLLINFNKDKKFTSLNLNLFVINILILCLNIYAQLSDIDKLATSLLLGIVPLYILIDSFNNYENKIISNFIILSISIFSILFAFGLENAENDASRSAYFKDLKNMENKFKSNEISYFSKQKWSKNSWNTLNKFMHFQKKIKNNCNVNYGANLTINTFYYSLLEYEKIQLIPFFFKDLDGLFRNYFEPNLIRELQREIDKNNIIIISSENNDKYLNLQEYADPKKIDLNAYNDKISEFLYIYYPKKCENN
jgi:hypothetical protein